MRTIKLQQSGEVIFKKSKRAKRLILKIDQTGRPVVTVPYLVPYAAAKLFAVRNQDWIDKHRSQRKVVIFTDKQIIGKLHELRFLPRDNPIISSRLSSNYATVYYPKTLSEEHSLVQLAAKKAQIKVVRKEAELLLPAKLYELASLHGYHYQSVGLKNMRSRWGSCSSRGSISLNIWLSQLPEELIEYVCCHELAHLKHPHHQPAFWQAVEDMVPDYPMRRKKLRQHQVQQST